MSDPYAGVPRLGTHERELLVLCARTALSDPQARRVDELLERRLDWEALSWYARLHSVAPLLHHHLRRSRAYGDLPERARQRLFALHHRAVYQNHHFAREGRLLIEAFREAGIELIVAKGVALLDLIYRDRTLRPLIDIDLLVPAGELDRAMCRLRELGYVRKPTGPIERIYRWSCPQFVFTASRDIVVSVLLRWTLMNWPRAHRFAPAGLWDRAEPATVCGVEALTLSPVDLLVYMCVQADNHGYFNRVGLDRMEAGHLVFAPWTNNRLIRFTDLLEVIREYDERIDWSLVVQRARESGLQEAVYTSLSMTNSLLGPVAPREVLEQLRDRPRHRLRGWVFGGITQGRLPGRIWMRGPETRRMRLARLLAFAEFAFPDRNSLSLLRGSRTPLDYAQHVTGAAGRAAAGFLRAGSP